MSIESMDSFID